MLVLVYFDCSNFKMVDKFSCLIYEVEFGDFFFVNFLNIFILLFLSEWCGIFVVLNLEFLLV